MTYERFEDLPVWQKAADLYEATEELLAQDDFKATRGFRDQLDRAALSVSNKTRQEAEREKRRAEFDKVILRHLPVSHPKRKEAEAKGLI